MSECRRIIDPPSSRIFQIFLKLCGHEPRDNVDHIITGRLLPEVSREFLSRLAEGLPIQKAHVSVDKEGKFVYQIT